MALRIVFCGTPAFAVPSLRHLLAQPDMEIAGVVTQPDRPAGRGRETSVPAVKTAAREAGLAVYQPERIGSPEAAEYFLRLAPEAVVIIAYGQIIPRPLLEIPGPGTPSSSAVPWINLHASLLPKYRGAAPIAWAIVQGETRTGLTTMRIDAGLDTGPLLLKYETEIGADETASQLSSRLAEAGAPLVAETLRKLGRGEIAPVPQDNADASYAPALKKEDGRIHWLHPARAIYNRIRGLDPWPGAHSSFRGKSCQLWGRLAAAGAPASPPGTILAHGEKVLVACGDSTMLRLEFVQMEGRKRISARDFANGARLGPADRFV